MGSQTRQTRSATSCSSSNSLTKPDVVSLLHEVVISLCQRKYSSLPGVEIDGIICISFSESSEQQVVKIHETLNTNTQEFCKIADNKARNNPADTNEPSTNQPNATKIPAESPPQINFQHEVSNLSDLLKLSNSMCANNTQSSGTRSKPPPSEPGEKVRKRKRKPVRNPKAGDVYENSCAGASIHNTPIVMETVNEINTACEYKQQLDTEVYNNALADATDSNLIIVKEEVHDDEYYAASCPKVVSVFSRKDTPAPVGCTDTDRQLPDADIDNVAGQVSSWTSPPIAHGENTTAEKTDYNFSFPVQVKKEREDLGYESAYGTIKSSYHGNISNQHQSDEENVFQTSDIQSYMENSDGAYSKDSDAGDAPDSVMTPYIQNRFDDDEPETKKKRTNAKKKSDEGKLWNEMITTNVSRYQAALMRGKLKPSGTEPNPVVQSQVRDMLEIKSMVKNYVKHGEFAPTILESPSIKMESVDSDEKELGSAALHAPTILESPSIKMESVDSDEKELGSAALHEDYSLHERSESPPRDITHGERGRSSSPAQGPDDVSDGMNDDKTSLPSEEMTDGQKQKQGELGLQYPSLFNQLQTAKASSSATDTAGQPESLVNRLPFISFQELFAGTSTEAAAKEQSQIAGLLTSESPERANTSTPSVSSTPENVNKKRWNWKKRAVRPRGPNGEILSPDKYALAQPVANKFGASCTVPTSSGSNRASSKAKSEDREWKPSWEDLRDVSQDRVVTPKVSTRLSSSDKVRKSFADIESDFDVDTPDEEEIQFVSAYCPKGCGAKFTTIEARDVHGDTCGGGKDLKCDICGLDFNQQYRWQYHMIKVHGVQADQSMLFR